MNDTRNSRIELKETLKFFRSLKEKKKKDNVGRTCSKIDQGKERE